MGSFFSWDEQCKRREAVQARHDATLSLRPVRIFLTVCIASFLFSAGCVTFAPPSPMVTFGGPETAGKGVSETALAFGTGAVLFEDAHTGGAGWFGRYKYGLGENFDLGIDALGVTYSDKTAFTAKLAGRYAIRPGIRVEAGIGAADDSNGKSLNSDIGVTVGSIGEDSPWNFYSSLRAGYAFGFAGNAIFSTTDESTDTVPLPNTAFTMLNLGAQGKIIEGQFFIFEAGVGGVFPEGEDPGMIIYLSCGLLFKIGGEGSK